MRYGGVGGRRFEAHLVPLVDRHRRVKAHLAPLIGRYVGRAGEGIHPKLPEFGSHENRESQCPFCVEHLGPALIHDVNGEIFVAIVVNLRNHRDAVERQRVPVALIQELQAILATSSATSFGVVVAMCVSGF